MKDDGSLVTWFNRDGAGDGREGIYIYIYIYMLACKERVMVPECLETLLFNPRRCFALAPLGLDAQGSWR